METKKQPSSDLYEPAELLNYMMVHYQDFINEWQ